jgi:hypothetical protein
MVSMLVGSQDDLWGRQRVGMDEGLELIGLCNINVETSLEVLLMIHIVAEVVCQHGYDYHVYHLL